jgi:biopolymer transport protein ExbB/TolQ
MHAIGDPFPATATVTWCILAVAAVSAALVAERLYVVLRARPDRRAFIEKSIQLVRAGKVDDALKLCTESRGVLSDIGLLILRSRSRDEAELRSIAETATLAIEPRLRRRLAYLRGIAVVALLLGLAGATTAAVATPGAPVDVAALLEGMRAPWLTGLWVAIGTVAFHTLLRGQVDAVADQMREYAARLINVLTDRPDVRLGHR